MDPVLISYQCDGGYVVLYRVVVYTASVRIILVVAVCVKSLDTWSTVEVPYKRERVGGMGGLAVFKDFELGSVESISES